MPITEGFHYPDVYSRHDDKPVKNKFDELCSTIKNLTGSSIFENTWCIIRKVVEFDADSGDEGKYYQCMCSCYELKTNFIVKHIPSQICFTVGSECIKKFENENLTKQISYINRESPKCIAGNEIRDKRTHFGKLELCDDTSCKCRPCLFCHVSKFTCKCHKCIVCKCKLNELWKSKCTDCYYNNNAHASY